MCMVVTIVSLIFLSASKLFITEVLIEKKNMSGRLLLTHSGLGQINAYGIAFPHHKQLGAYLFHPRKPSFSKARNSVPTREPRYGCGCGSGTRMQALDSVTCNFISTLLQLKSKLIVFGAHNSPHANGERHVSNISDDVLPGI